MAIGAAVRRAFGPYERDVAEAWRAVFFDLDDWIDLIWTWNRTATRILELGCGEGYSTERLEARFPHAEIIAIDIAQNIGRLYKGPEERVTFQIIEAEALAIVRPAQFDLVVLADVIHHIPASMRPSVLQATRTLLAPGGCLALKDWERRSSLIHALAYSADRWLTGDMVSYLTPAEMRHAVGAVYGADNIGPTCRLRPWAHNYAFKAISP
jgi:trans-aconitate methyltransferase